MTALILAAAFLGFLHTVLGADHYVPFISMSRLGAWSGTKTFRVTFLSGLGHVGSSISICVVGLVFAVNVGKLQAFEGARGSAAAWAMLIFGFIYLVFGIKKIFSRKEREEISELKRKKDMSAWILFAVFVFGPCEPLIPVVMLPAAKYGYAHAAAAALAFSVATIATMLALVMGSYYGLNKLQFKGWEKYSHALAGGAVFACGFAMAFLGM